MAENGASFSWLVVVVLHFVCSFYQSDHTSNVSVPRAWASIVYSNFTFDLYASIYLRNEMKRQQTKLMCKTPASWPTKPFQTNIVWHAKTVFGFSFLHFPKMSIIFQWSLSWNIHGMFCDYRNKRIKQKNKKKNRAQIRRRQRWRSKCEIIVSEIDRYYVICIEQVKRWKYKIKEKKRKNTQNVLKRG